MKSIIFFFLITGVATMLVFQTNSSAVSGLGRIEPVKTETSPQPRDGYFNNRAESLRTTISNFVSSTWEFLFGGQDRTPDLTLPMKPTDLSHFNKSAGQHLNVTWLGHSSLMINIDGYKILTDPVFEKRISMLGPSRFNGDVPQNIDHVPPIDVVIISHDHYDHLNKFSVQRLNAKTGKFIVPLGVGARIEEWNVPRHKIVELDWWEEFRFDAKLLIAAAPAQHFSGRGLFDRNETLWASWIVKTSDHSIFFSGDSGYFDAFKDIGDKYGPFDMTFIECGAYNESWSQVHMFPEQTVQAHLDLKGDVLHPIHWGTFNLSLHPWYEPMERIAAAAKAAQVPIATPVVGDTTVYRVSIPMTKWWEQGMNMPADVNITAAIDVDI